MTLALCGACTKGDEGLGEYLIVREKAPVNGVIGLDNAPLYAAIDSGQTNMVSLLIKYGVNTNPWDLDKHSDGLTKEIKSLLFAPPASTGPEI